MFIVFAVPTTPQPGEGPFHDPALRQHLESICAARAFDEFDDTTKRLFHKVRQAASTVGRVDKDHPDAFHLLPQRTQCQASAVVGGRRLFATDLGGFHRSAVDGTGLPRDIAKKCRSTADAIRASS